MTLPEAIACVDKISELFSPQAREAFAMVLDAARDVASDQSEKAEERGEFVSDGLEGPKHLRGDWSWTCQCYSCLLEQAKMNAVLAKEPRVKGGE